MFRSPSNVGSTYVSSEGDPSKVTPKVSCEELLRMREAEKAYGAAFEKYWEAMKLRTGLDDIALAIRLGFLENEPAPRILQGGLPGLGKRR